MEGGDRPQITQITQIIFLAVLMAVVPRLNSRPRESPDHRTPNEVFNEAVVALQG